LIESIALEKGQLRIELSDNLDAMLTAAQKQEGRQKRATSRCEFVMVAGAQPAEAVALCMIENDLPLIEVGYVVEVVQRTDQPLAFALFPRRITGSPVAHVRLVMVQAVGSHKRPRSRSRKGVRLIPRSAVRSCSST
jgi:hypothetical protein